MLASLALVASCLIGGISTGFWSYLIAVSFWGIFDACYVGAYDSIVYDTLIEETGDASGFEQYYGKVQVREGAALVAGALFSTLVTHYLGLRAAYFLTIPTAILSLVALHYFREPKEHKKAVAELMKAHIVSTFRAVFRNVEVFWVVFTLVLVGVALQILLEFDQLWLIALSFPLVFYGPTDALFLSGVSAGGIFASHLKSKKLLLGVVAIQIVCSVLLLIKSWLAVTVGLAVLITAFFVLNIIFGKLLHDTLAAGIRAGSNSIVTTLGYVVFIPVGLIFGAISKHASVFSTAWIVILIVCLTALGIVMTLSYRQTKLEVLGALD